MSQFTIVSSGPPEWHELLRITGESKARYARRWGYEYKSNISNFVDPHLGRPLRGFIKFDLMLHELVYGDCEWVVWIDGDALITNYERRMEDILATTPHKCLRGNCQGISTHDFITGYDHNSHHTTVMFARKTQQVQEYLWAANNTGRRLFIDHPWHEMESLRYFAQLPPYHDLTGWVGIKNICGILIDEYRKFGVPSWLGDQYAWSPGDWVLHLSALSLKRRLQLAAFYANPANHRFKAPRALTEEEYDRIAAAHKTLPESEVEKMVFAMEGRAEDGSGELLSPT